MKWSLITAYILGLLYLIVAFAYGLAAECRGSECVETKQLSWGEWLKAQAEHFKVPNFKWQTKEPGNPLEIVNFVFFNKENYKTPEKFKLSSNDGRMYKDFDPKKPTKILVHGWMGSVESKFSTAMVNAYVPAFDYNVILADWGSRATKFYPTARDDVTLVGKILADFIDLLCRTYKIDPQMLHVIGHSLGAHVSGIAGRFITSGKLGRISGLDPALPLFTENGKDTLNTKSATFVDVIHTCGKYLGWYGRLGHADFYPNKGTAAQPGCGVDALGKCSHRRAWVYFAESVQKPNMFMAVKCDNWEKFQDKKCNGKLVSMGEYLPKDTNGVFYLSTNKEEPFARVNQ